MYNIYIYKYIIIYPDTAKLQSNHKFYKSDIKPAIDHSDTNYNTTTHLVQAQDETLGEATHSYSSFAFPEI